MYRVTITYVGVQQDPEMIVAPICQLFKPTPSYVDTIAYKEGVAGENGYGPSVYRPNTPGMGHIDLPDHFAETSIPFPIPLTQFRLAVVGEDNTVTFEVSDYKEAFYYKEVGAALKDQGFDVVVEDESATANVEVDPSGEADA
jgi:hypothetical protein